MPTYMGEDEAIQKNKELEGLFYTTKDLEALPEDARAELMDGHLYYMATPSSMHQRIITFLILNIGNHIKTSDCSCEIYPASTALYLHKDNQTYLEPDIMIVCDPGKMDEKGCHGAPDFVAEVVSPSTRSRDYLLKLNQYQKADVREYWIVDLEWRRVIVYAFSEETVHIYDFNDRVPVGILDGLEIDFSECKLSF